MFAKLRNAFSGDEEGHAIPAIAGLAGAAGGVILGIGAANDSGVWAIAGGILLGAGVLAYVLVDHILVDYGIFGRIEKLEGTRKD